MKHDANRRASSVNALLGPLACLALLVIVGCADHSPRGEVTRVAVTTSWLECCVRDIAGADLPVTRLCPPGSCPGHFDLNPGVISELKGCRTLFRFDFQQSLDARLAPTGIEIVAVTAPKGLCLPSSYLASCKDVHTALIRARPEVRADYDRALEVIRSRLRALEADVRQQIHSANLKEATVVVSGHQAVFCRWLELRTLAAYSGAEAASPRQLDRLIREGREAGVRFVIANLQEGRQQGEALAYHLGAPLVVFSNFPDMSATQASFDALVRDNVARLIAATQDPR